MSDPQLNPNTIRRVPPTDVPPTTSIKSTATDPSIAHLMGELVADAQHLIRKELELARQEVKVEIDKGKQAAISLGIGGAIAAAGGLLLLFMLVHLLTAVFVIALWISYLIVGGILLIIGLVLLQMGRSDASDIDPTPHETIDSVRKDVEWIQEQSPLSKK